MRRLGSAPRFTGDPIADVAAILSSLGIRHVFSGGYALAPYGTPRGTNDVDVIVHAKASDFRRLTRFAHANGMLKDPAAFLRAVGRGDIGVLYTRLANGRPFKVEVIPAGGHFPLTLDRAILRRSRILPHDVRKQGVRMISPDDLVVAKLLFFRDKDRPDIENLLRAGTINPRAVLARMREYVDSRDDVMAERVAWFRAAVQRNVGRRR